MWLMLLKKYWLHLIIAGCAAYVTHWVDSAYYNHRNKEALAKQEETLVKACQADKAITTEVSHEYQQNNAKLRADIVRLNRLYDNTCVPVTGTPARPDAATSTGKLAGPGGIAPKAIFALAAEGEGYRLQVIGLQDFITRTWKARGQ